MYPLLSCRKNAFLIHVEEAPGMSLCHCTLILLSWGWPLLSAGCFSCHGFLILLIPMHTFPKIKGFSFTCSRLILMVSCMYSSVLAFFCSIELVKFICVGTCNGSLFIFPREPFEVLNINSRQGLYTWTYNPAAFCSTCSVKILD